MRKLAVTLLLVLAACKAETNQTGADTRERQAAAAPDVHVTEAAGIALTYAYSFRLPAERIGATQEKHAMQCEALGPTKCRIAGMSYHVDPNRSVEGTLDLRLAPELARAYGKKGITTVGEDGGMLSDATITSVEAGAQVAAADRADAAGKDEQKQIEAMLTKPGLGDVERTQLQDRLAYLRDRKTDIAAVRADAVAQLASTPVVFNYASGVIDTGFGEGPFLGAIKSGWANMVSGLLVIVTMLVTFLPWIVLAVLLFWLWRRYLKRLLARIGGE